MRVITRLKDGRAAGIAIVALCLALAGGLVASIATPSEAATAWKPKSVHRSSCPSALGCVGFEVKVAATVKYTNNKKNKKVAMTSGPTCLVDHSYGTDVTIGWCGYVYGNAAHTWVSIGVNYKVSLLHNGAPLAQGYWARIKVDWRGKVTYEGNWRCDFPYGGPGCAR
jgi:hypothetical protein